MVGLALVGCESARMKVFAQMVWSSARIHIVSILLVLNIRILYMGWNGKGFYQQDKIVKHRALHDVDTYSAQTVVEVQVSARVSESAPGTHSPSAHRLV